MRKLRTETLSELSDLTVKGGFATVVGTRATREGCEQVSDTMSIDQWLGASLPEGCPEPAPAIHTAKWLSPLQDFVAGGGDHRDYQEDLVLSVNGLSR